MDRRDFLQLIGGAAVIRVDQLVLTRGSGASAPRVRDAQVSRGTPWLESLTSATPIFLRPRPGKDAVFPLKPDDAAARRLDEMRDAGIGMIEVYAPAEAGNSFLGLDTINRYRVDPRIGTMDDFRRLVDLAHARGLKIINIDNLGYSSVEAVDFLKACDDVRAGKASRETRFYCWSDSADAPPPVPPSLDRYFMVRPTHLAGYDATKNEFWQKSDRAGKFYWTKWPGVDLAGNKVRLPQYNWSTDEFQEEVEKIVRFWMDTGIDGMMIDAVNWYVGCDWASNRKRMTDAIASYGNDKYSQPEGAGAFHEDPVPWITDGGWACVQDYGLGIFWEKGTNVVTNAIESGDPRPIERALREYHDRVVEAGGVLYFNPPRFDDPRKNRLATAFAAGAGDLVCWASVIDGLWSPVVPDADEARILKVKAAHAAMHNRSRRQALPVTASDKHYAFVRAARSASERLLVALNFQAVEQDVEIDASGVDFERATDLLAGTESARQLPLRLTLPAYGYAFLDLSGRKARS